MNREEQALRRQAARVKGRMEAALDQRDYLRALRLAASLAPAIHRFFNHVRILE